MMKKKRGIIIKIQPKQNTLTVKPFTKHSGSEFDVVIMIVPQSSPMLLTRNLLYTGMTRAKKMLIVIGNSNVIDFMIKNADIKKRNTGLEEKFKNIL